MIYIPTLTTKLQKGIHREYDNILYSPNPKISKVYKGKNITIWDNHTFYYLRRYHKPDKVEKAIKHYYWLIDYIKDNWQEGITLITPDVDWCNAIEIEERWNKECYRYPQLYVPNSWKTSIDKLNIVGYALRKDMDSNLMHSEWTHCLAHKRNINCKLLTYDATVPIL